VIERTGSASGISYVPYEEAYREGFEELGRRRPNTAAIERLLEWRPQRTIDDAIDDLVAYTRPTEAKEREAVGPTILTSGLEGAAEVSA
jgi:UDP-glucose 4-epimerase